VLKDDEDQNKTSIRILAWNLHHFNSGCSTIDLGVVSSAILASDITVFTEVSKDADFASCEYSLHSKYLRAQIICNKGLKNDKVIAEPNDISTPGERIVFFVNKNKVKVENYCYGRFDHTNGQTNRRPVFIGCTALVTGFPFILVGVHCLAKGSGNDPRKDVFALREISPYVKSALQSNIDIIFAGDFNCDPWKPKMLTDDPKNPIQNYMPTVQYDLIEKDSKGNDKVVTVEENTMALIDKPTMVDGKSNNINDNILIPQHLNLCIEPKSAYVIKDHTFADSPADQKKQKFKK